MVWPILTKDSLNNYTSPFEVRHLRALGSNLLRVSQIKVKIPPGAVGVWHEMTVIVSTLLFCSILSICYGMCLELHQSEQLLSHLTSLLRSV